MRLDHESRLNQDLLFKRSVCGTLLAGGVGMLLGSLAMAHVEKRLSDNAQVGGRVRVESLMREPNEGYNFAVEPRDPKKTPAVSMNGFFLVDCEYRDSEDALPQRIPDEGYNVYDSEKDPTGVDSFTIKVGDKPVKTLYAERNNSLKRTGQVISTREHGLLFGAHSVTCDVQLNNGEVHSLDKITLQVKGK